MKTTHDYHRKQVLTVENYRNHTKYDILVTAISDKFVTGIRLGKFNPLDNGDQLKISDHSYANVFNGFVNVYPSNIIGEHEDVDDNTYFSILTTCLQFMIGIDMPTTSSGKYIINKDFGTGARVIAAVLQAISAVPEVKPTDIPVPDLTKFEYRKMVV